MFPPNSRFYSFHWQYKYNAIKSGIEDVSKLFECENLFLALIHEENTGKGLVTIEQNKKHQLNIL